MRLKFDEQLRMLNQKMIAMSNMAANIAEWVIFSLDDKVVKE